MRLLVYYPQRLPYPTGIGGAVVTWALVQSAVERGHKVLVVSNRNTTDAGQEKSKAALISLGAEVRLVEAPLEPVALKQQNRLSFFRQTVWPMPKDFYSSEFAVAPQLEQVVREFCPDAIYLYPVEAAVATNRIDNLPPRLAVQVNLGGTSYRRRLKKLNSVRETLTDLRIQLSERKWDQFIAKELAKCELVISHAAHSAEWLRENGVPQCRYLANPVVDAVGENWLAQREEHEAQISVPKLLVVGNVMGTPQRASLKFLSEELLEILSERLKPGSYEVHIVGGGKMKPDLAKKLNRPEVRIRGFVDDIAAEFLSSTLLLVPTPINLGARTRIVEGFSFGCCVVTHECDRAGMPEIKHNHNALVGSNAKEIADHVYRALNDSGLRRRISATARLTYEQELSADVVCGAMLSDMERLASSSRGGCDSMARTHLVGDRTVARTA